MVAGVLTVTKIYGADAASYYLEQVARGTEDYYAGDGEQPGTWVGAGTPSLGLKGDVAPQDFTRLLEGAGVRSIRAGGVNGFDLTFRAPKSVSVLWAIAPREIRGELRAAHEQAVAEALGYLQREACRARRGKDGLVQVQGQGYVGAAFVHRSSRAGDPLLHTHVVIGNLTQGPDGRWTALDGRHIYRHGKTGGCVYQAVLRRELTERLGVAWTPVEHGMADIEGVPRDVIEHFSRRRAQIREHMAEHGVHSPAAAHVAALETRKAKQHVPIDRLRADWTARAVEHGLTPEMIPALLGRERACGVEAPSELLRELTEQASSFGRAELIRALAEHAPTGARLAEVRRQNQAWDRHALDALRNGDIEHWARAYREHGSYADVGITAVRPTSGLCRHGWRGRRWVAVCGLLGSA